MPTHTTLSGHRIEHDEPSPDVVSFLARLHAMLIDPRGTENEMIGLAYSRENPILDHTLFPERGAVTRDVLANPLYHVVTDLLSRKRVATEGLDVEQLAAEYTESVPDAAKRLGITEDAVRKAINARRVPSWVKDGRYFLDPRTATPAVLEGKRGPSTSGEQRREAMARARDPVEHDTTLEMRIGNAEGRSFRVRAPELETLTKDANMVTARLAPGWTKVGIISGGEGQDRFFLIVPGVGENEIAWGPFFIRGRFNIAERVNNGDRARDAWKAFRAA